MRSELCRIPAEFFCRVTCRGNGKERAMTDRLIFSPDLNRDGRIVRKENGVFIFPGFCDVHVHFREPGFSYKETIVTGSRAAIPPSVQCRT